MRRWIVAIVLFSSLGGFASAQDAQPAAATESRPTLQQGAWYLSGFSGLTGFASWANDNTADGDADTSQQSYDLHIAGGYFIVDYVALGPAVRAEFSRAVDSADNVRTELGLSLGIQGAYYFELRESPWVPVGRLAVAYERRTVKDDEQVDDRVENGFSVSPKLGVNYFFTERVAGGGEVVYSFSRRTTENGDTTVIAHTVGVGLGITFFFW